MCKRIINLAKEKEMCLLKNIQKYYVKERTMHSAASQFTGVAAKITGKSKEDAAESAKDVDLNEVDEHSWIYKILGGIFENVL